MITFLIIILLFFTLFFLWRFLFFFRNPLRTSSADANAILSPADGYVLYIRYIQESDTEVFSIKNKWKIYLHELMLLRQSDISFMSGWLIGIVMSPLDVHYNRAPVSGFIRRIGYEFPSSLRKNFNMFPALQNLFFRNEQPYNDCNYLVHNERASYVIENDRFRVFVTQIADKYVRKIVTYKNNTAISRGEIFGMIRMGSQVDLFIPDKNGIAEIAIKAGKHLKAGKDVIAYM
jgi:phosphatidylserine decarboxylase